MALPKLSVEIFQHIIRQFQLKRLILIHDKWPESDPLRKIILGVTYERISFGDYKDIEGFRYSKRFLAQLAFDKVSVHCLKVIDSGGCYEAILLILHDMYPEFLPSIPRIDFDGRVEKLKEYSRIATFDRIQKCHLKVFNTLDFVPSKVKEIALKNISSAELSHSFKR